MAETEQTRGSDPVIAALDEVEQAVAANLKDERELLGELERVRADRQAGRPMRHVLGEGRPRAVILAGRVASRVTRAGARLQQGLAHSLAREGESVTSIARRFEVSHQRVSTILRRARHTEEQGA
ncbi:MAG TPA: hypothetical protein VNF07_12320 [Acidimicrobiales bacterium]|nr:hypothetical protein [Acidimicrobiales bacterium]